MGHLAGNLADDLTGDLMGDSAASAQAAPPSLLPRPLITMLQRFPRLSMLIIGAVSATGFAPLNLWPLALLCLALLLHCLGTAPTLRRAFALGWMFGFGHFALGNNWIATAFTYQAAMPAWLGWVAVGLLSLYLAIFPALASASAWWLWRKGLGHKAKARHAAQPGAPTPSLILIFAATWVITEWLRSWVFTGFAWNPLGALMVNQAQMSAFIGSYGLSGLVCLAAGALLLLSHRRWKPALLLAALLICAHWLVVFWLDGSNPDATYERGPHVTIVQPNIDQGDKWDMAQRRANFAKLAALSPRLPGSAPRLLLWPEAAVPDYLENGYPLDWYVEAPSFTRARLASQLGQRDLLLTGAVKLEPNAANTDIDGARNSLFVLNAGQQLQGRYDKAHLVPYGEYLPMRPILSAIGLSRLAPGAVDFWPGPGARTLDLRAQGFGKVGVQICYEMIFSGQVVDRADRPDFIFNPSNDAWFGDWGPPQHLAQARLRAVEEGLPVVRATPTGISAIIDADGRVVTQIAQHRAGRIDAAMPPAHRPTLFATYGNALPLCFAMALLMLAFLAPRRSALALGQPTR